MRLLGLPALVAGSLLATGCERCGKERAPSGAEAAAPATLAPVPAPASLVATAWARQPDALWARVQRGVSGAIALLPQDEGSLAVALAGLDASVAGLVDGKETALVVVGRPLSGALSWVVALPLKDAARARATLAAGDAAPYAGSATVDASGMTRLAAAGARPAGSPCALGGRWLLVGASDAALSELGPYAFRTAPGLPVPAGAAAHVEVAQPALAGPVAAALRALWTSARAELVARDEADRARHGGRAPDFADPGAILAVVDALVDRRVSLVSRARELTVDLDADEASVRVDASLTHGAADLPGAARAPTGDARPLLDLPADAVAGVLLRDDAASRADDARDLADAVAHVFAGRASADDLAATRKAAEDWASGRGDWVAAALTGSPRGVVLRAPGNAASSAVREGAELLRRRFLGDPLRAGLEATGPRFEAPAVPGLTEVGAVTLAPRAGPPLGLAWGEREATLWLAAGERPADLLSAEAAASAKVADDPRLAESLAAVGGEAAGVAFAQPLRLSASRARLDSARAHAVVAWGRHGERAWLRLDAAGELVRELVRAQAGL